MKPIEDRLRETLGLDTGSVGANLIRGAVRQRMRGLGLKRFEDYQKLLEHSRGEWHDLVDSVVVTETWFFRDPEAIAAWARLVREKWLPTHPAARFRLLSVPCSSGEEPFSLVMALVGAGVPADRFQVEASDISLRALARARRGIYGKNSFRGKDLAFRDRYFRPSAEGFVLDRAVRNCVRFYPGNFLSADFPAGEASYDFIFCRNLLIYLDPAMRRKALEKLQRLLTPAGVLFVGPAEKPLALDHGFVMADIPLAFAFRKAGCAVHRQRLDRPASGFRRALSFQPGGRRQPQLQTGGRPLSPPPSRAAPALGTDLETARELADAGYLEEAAGICEAHLRVSRTSAQAYYLLGLVRDARGEPEALDCYRKALYLEPNHYERLLQTALLLQKKGEAGRARVFRDRAQRLRMKR